MSFCHRIACRPKRTPERVPKKKNGGGNSKNGDSEDDAYCTPHIEFMNSDGVDYMLVLSLWHCFVDGGFIRCAVEFLTRSAKAHVRVCVWKQACADGRRGPCGTWMWGDGDGEMYRHVHTENMCSICAVLRSIQMEMGELNSQPASYGFAFTHHKLHARTALVRAEIMCNTLIPSKSDAYSARSHSRRQGIRCFFLPEHRLSVAEDERLSSSSCCLSFILYCAVL